MTKRLVALAIFVTIAGCSQPAANESGDAAPASAAASEGTGAASAPNMKGTWVGTSHSIVKGTTRHHAAATGSQPLLDEIQFTYVIDGQDGNRFWGVLSSPMSEETMTGVVGLDGKRVVARTSEGEIDGVLTDPDTIQLIYSAGGEAPAVAVNTMRRQK